MTTNDDQTSWLCRLPSEILQIITGFLNTSDVVSLGQTCQTFYKFFSDKLKLFIIIVMIAAARSDRGYQPEPGHF